MVAAGRVIARRGLGAASVDEISEDAGYSSGAFYSNFESKDDVFAAALDYHAEELARFFSERGESGSVSRRLTADAEWLGQLDDWKVLFWLEIVAHGGRSRRLRPAVRDHLAAARGRLAEQIAAGAAESGSPLPRSPEELAAVALATEIGLFVQRLFDADAVAPEALPELVGRMAGER